MGWTEERVELLKKLWQDGLSASQIARQLGGVTRNAVIGKVRRMHLPYRTAPRHGRPQPPAGSVLLYAPSSPRAIRGCEKDAPLPARRFRTSDQPCSMNSCSWPIGHPGALGFSFCGDEAADGPYCVRHTRVAYQPSSKDDVRKLMRGLRRYL